MNINYCINCGEEHRIEYLESYADFDEWKCRICGETWQTASVENE